MKEETINALDVFIQIVTHAIKVALPNAPETVKKVESAARDLRDQLQDEDLS